MECLSSKWNAYRRTLMKIGKVEDFAWFPEVPEHAAAMVGGSVGRIPQPSFTSLTFLETAKKACFSDTEQK